MLDQPEGALRDRTAERLDPRAHVIVGVDGLADVVQERRQQELLVIRARLARQLEDLQAVIERIAFGMIAGILLDRFQRRQPHLVDGEPVEMIGQRRRHPAPLPRHHRPLRVRRRRRWTPSRARRVDCGPRRPRAGRPAGCDGPARPPPSAWPRTGRSRSPRPASRPPTHRPSARSTNRAAAPPRCAICWRSRCVAFGTR